ncbi:MAG: hypothetical protein KDA49_13255 [Rhodospirillaceae bacterium]|nr:hypothetical protein [Rhodospirillaceae bacterium]MCA8933437.1 hypothetical protein [Rhodospirillaceae bacterium]
MAVTALSRVASGGVLEHRSAPAGLVPGAEACRQVRHVYRHLCGEGATRHYALLAAVDALWRHHPDLAEDAANDTVLEILTTP